MRRLPKLAMEAMEAPEDDRGKNIWPAFSEKAHMRFATTALRGRVCEPAGKEEPDHSLRRR